MLVTEKTCRRCGATKPAAAFNKNTKRKDGLTSYCKGCFHDYHQRRAGKPDNMGVYAVTLTLTGARYVGSSANLAKRFAEHLSELRRGKSRHPLLQQAWAQHGEEHFTFEVLELVPERERLLDVEQKWIDATPLLLNRSRDAYRPHAFERTPEQLARMSRISSERMKDPAMRALTSERLKRYFQSEGATERHSIAMRWERKPHHLEQLRRARESRTARLRAQKEQAKDDKAG